MTRKSATLSSSGTEHFVNMASARVFFGILTMIVTIQTITADDDSSSAPTKCAKGFYLSEPTEDNPDTSCEICDKSCLTFCRGKGPKGCEVCRDGYSWDPDYGCLDVDECHELGYNPCQRNSFCVNTEGQYECFGE